MGLSQVTFGGGGWPAVSMGSDTCGEEGRREVEKERRGGSQEGEWGWEKEEVDRDRGGRMNLGKKQSIPRSRHQNCHHAASPIFYHPKQMTPG